MPAPHQRDPIDIGHSLDFGAVRRETCRSMTRDIHDDDDDAEADAADRDLPDESDMDSFDEPSLVPCPHCRRMITEDTEQCPHCRTYLSAEDAPHPRPAWLIAVVIATIIVVLFAWIMLGR